MFKKITLVSLVLFGFLLFWIAGECFADVSAQLEQAKLGIISLIKEGHYSQAQIQTRKLLADFSQNPALPQSLYEIAAEYREENRYKEEKDVYQQIIRDYPDNPLVSRAQLGFLRAEVLSLIVSHKDTEQALNKLITDFPGHPDLPDAFYSIGKKYGWFEKYEEEMAVDQRLMRDYPDNPFANKARLCFSRAKVQSLIISQDYDRAKEALDKLIVDFSNHPDLPEELYWTANRYKYSDKYEEAQDLYRQIIKNYPDNRFANKAKLGVPVMDAMSFITSQDSNKTGEALDKLLIDFKDHPDLPKTLLFMGERCYKQELSKEGDDPVQTKDNFEKAAKIYDRLINEFPASSPVPEACLWAGYSYRELGKHQESVRCFQKVVDDYPRYEYAWNAQYWIGECYEQMRISGALPESEATTKMEQAYQTFIEKYPAHSLAGHVCLKLSNLSFSRNEPAEAAAYLEIFLETSPDDPRVPDVLYDLGRAYEQTGQLDLAAKAYGKFIKAAPNNPLAEEVKAKLEKLEGAGK